MHDLCFQQLLPVPPARLRPHYHCHSCATVHASVEQPSPSPRAPSLPVRAPRTFVRLHPVSDGDEDAFLLQTAVTTYKLGSGSDSESRSGELHIHSMLHVADAAYYGRLQSDLSLFTARGGTVLFELLTSERNVTSDPYPRVLQRTQASPSARATAAAMRAAAQADALDVARPKWRLADVPVELQRQRPLQYDEEVGKQSDETMTTSTTDLSDTSIDSTRIILSIASVLLPCPELYLALLLVSQSNSISMRGMLAGSLPAARRATFALRIVSACSAVRPQRGTAKLRNAVAWDAVRDSVPPLAVLYGAWHSPALCSCAEGDGWVFDRTTWRTAMRVRLPRPSPRALFPWAVAAAAYAVYAAADWVHLATAGADVGAQLVPYIARHAAAYVLFERWFRTWDD